MRLKSSKNYLLTVLLIILAFNYVDRLALGLVLEDIKHDLQLTDTQLGFLSGIAFALFYAVMGIPIGRWADRGNRVTIISVTTALWSAAVALCGAATSFVQLLVIRVGVGIGEAGCYPPALSLISDRFDRAQRPRAVSRYMLGWPLALVIGYFATGWLNELYGWRVTFVLIGLPGLALALLARLTLHEPRCTPAAPGSTVSAALRPASSAVQPGLGKIVGTLWRNTAFRHLLISASLSYFFTFGIMQWQPAFFVRSHGLETGELGTWFAAVYGAGGFLGTYLGGELASRLAVNNESLQLKAIAVVTVLHALVMAGAYLVPSHHLAFSVLFLAVFGGAATNGPLLAATQSVVPAQMRATSIAVILFFSNLIGLGFGPLAAGALSDYFQPLFGTESLRYSLLALCPGYFWAAWHCWRASRAWARDAAVEREGEAVQSEVPLAGFEPPVRSAPAPRAWLG